MIRWLSTFLLICLSSPCQFPEVGVEKGLDKGWRKVRSPLGISISVPKGFKPFFSEIGGVRVLGNNGRMSPVTPYVVCYPVICLEGESALDFLEREILSQYLTLPDASLEKSAALKPGIAAAKIRYAIREIPRRAIIICVKKKTKAMVYLLSAPLRGFGKARQKLSRIAISLGYMKKDDREEKAPPPAAWESSDSAFRIHVPESWKTRGKVISRGILDFTPVLTLVSGSNETLVEIGHRRCAIFMEPDPILVASGIDEGRWYSPKQGTRINVLAYRPGIEFYTNYLELFEGKKGKEKPLIRRNDIPLSGILSTVLKKPVAAGELLEKDGKGRIFYTFCATCVIKEEQGRKTWKPFIYLHVETIPEKIFRAVHVATKALASLEYSRSWAKTRVGLKEGDLLALEKAYKTTADYISKNINDMANVIKKEHPGIFKNHTHRWSEFQDLSMALDPTLFLEF